MGNSKQKISVNPDSLIAAAAILKEAESNINSALAAVNTIGVSAIVAPGTSASGKMASIQSTAAAILSMEKPLFSNLISILQSNGEILKEADKINSGPSVNIADNERQKGEAHLKELEEQRRKRQNNYNSSSGSVSTYSSSSQSVNNSAPSDLATGVIGLPAMVVKPTESDVKTPIQPTVDIRTESYQKLENLLKNGTITSETTALYDTLKTLGMGDEADSLLKKYGYEASKDANGNTIISKIKSEPAKDNSGKVPNTSDADKKNNDSDKEVVAPEVKPSDDSKSKNSGKTSYNTVTRKEYSSPNRKYTTDETNTTQTTDPSPNSSDKNTPIVDNSGKKLPKDNKPNGKVITIDDDFPDSTKKSNGVGAAIPIGLGAIAAGAATVAGVRYVKNRHEDQEEYNEEYDDENNELDNNGKYVDSAEYSNSEDYTSDNYLGPAGSTYTDVSGTENDYVDPEELEMDSDNSDNSDFSSDKVLEQLNFDGQ